MRSELPLPGPSVSSALALTAVSLGAIHTLLGPDHWVPFIALAKTRGWSRRRALAVTAVCGVGHVAASVAIALAVLGLGRAAADAAALDAARGAIAAWLLLGTGLAYLLWGLRRGLRDRPHEHWHAHEGGVVHRHGHSHHGPHAHVHDARGGALTPWVLFVVLVLGPCESLIPLLLAAGAEGGRPEVALVGSLFAAATLGVMVAVVAAGLAGLSRLPLDRFHRWSHAAAGAALALCGLAVRLGL